MCMHAWKSISWEIKPDSQKQPHECTYGLDGLLVQGDLDVEILQVVVGRRGLRPARFLVHGLAPRAIHLVVLLGVLDLAAGTSGTHRHLLLLHHLHALHLHGLLLCILLSHPRLLLPVLLRLHLLPLLSRHLLLLLILLATVLIVVLLLLLTVVGLAGGPRIIGSHRSINNFLLILLICLLDKI